MTATAPTQLAIQGGTPVRTRPWPRWPIYDDTEVEALAEVVRSGKWFAHGGTKVKEFAERFAELQDARFAAPCTNGTQAIEIALRAVGVKAGDEVIVPPYTFIASASAIVAVNAVPVFVDIEPDTYNLDARRVEEAITERTAAILAVHIAGCPADLDALGEIARRRGLKLVEDAAQAVGAQWKGRHVGAIGDAGTFSFQASKNLNAGEGGVVLTDQEAVYDTAWSLINVGRVRDGGWYEHHWMSGNYRMSEWQAAILLAQMTRLEAQTERRNRNALYLAEQLSALPGIAPLRRDERVTRHAYHIFVFRYDAAAFEGLPRGEFLRALAAEGIPCSPGYAPLYRQGAFRINSETHPFPSQRVDYSQVQCPVAERICEEEAIWMGQSLLLAEREDMDDIVEAVGKIQRSRA
jgi:dTDP-4-amino-4,6-dideoxygalactose transaminase